MEFEGTGPIRPMVSIGIPVYNGEKYLATAIESLLAQSYTDFEIIISDNASTDRTQQIAEEYVVRDPRIRYDRMASNGGAILNFNRLVEMSRGKYFKWAAADDVCAPQYLEVLVEMMEQDPELVWCHTRSGKIDETGKVLSPSDEAAEGLAYSEDAGLPRHGFDSNRPSPRFRGVLLGTAWCADCYGLIRREVLQKTRLLPQCYGSEKVLMGELALHGRYNEFPERWFMQRVHSQASGHLATNSQQQQYSLGQAAKRKRSWSRLKLLSQHWESIRRTPLTIGERARCYRALAAYLFQIHKWRHVLQSVLTRQPLKGFQPTTLKPMR